jgi:hypothetical protein
MTDLTPREVLLELFDEADQVLTTNPEHAVETVIERLLGAGFEIRPVVHGEGHADVKSLVTVQRLIDVGSGRLRAEVARLQDAKRRALQVADERAKELVTLRAEVEKLRSQPPIAWLITYADGQKQYRDSEPRVMPTPDSRLTPLYERALAASGPNNP